MLRNFFKQTVRSLKKNKAYSFLNIFGLAIGIACAGLIFLWVEDETTFNDNHVNKDRVYIVKVNDQEDKGMFTHSSTPGPMAAVIQGFTGVETTCRMSEDDNPVPFGVGDKTLYASGYYAEP